MWRFVITWWQYFTLIFYFKKHNTIIHCGESWERIESHIVQVNTFIYEVYTRANIINDLLESRGKTI